MTIQAVHLRQFRSHMDYQAELGGSVTLILGDNGSGKTNFLEALYVLAHGTSFRDNDNELTMHGTDWWQTKAMLDDGSWREVRYQDHKKTTLMNGKAYSRPPQSSRLPVVLFEPDDLFMVHASPGIRRELIDRYLDHISVEFRAAKKHYERGLRQRNRLLKQPQFDQDSIFPWDVLLARYGAVLRSYRENLVTDYNQHLSRNYSHIAGETADIKVDYVSSLDSVNYEQQLLSGLRQRTDTDRLRGFTSVGPHRDDLQFYLNGNNMVTHASRGEIRSLLLALKQYEAVKERVIFGQSPLVLLDDVFSELDGKRQEQLLTLFENTQIVITSTDKPINLPDRAVILRM